MYSATFLILLLDFSVRYLLTWFPVYLLLIFFWFSLANKKKFLYQNMHLRNCILAYTTSFLLSYEKSKNFMMENIHIKEINYDMHFSNAKTVKAFYSLYAFETSLVNVVMTHNKFPLNVRRLTVKCLNLSTAYLRLNTLPDKLIKQWKL